MHSFSYTRTSIRFDLFYYKYKNWKSTSLSYQHLLKPFFIPIYSFYHFIPQLQILWRNFFLIRSNIWRKCLINVYYLWFYQFNNTHILVILNFCWEQIVFMWIDNKISEYKKRKRSKTKMRFLPCFIQFMQRDYPKRTRKTFSIYYQ